jgi:hypothetical protein
MNGVLRLLLLLAQVSFAVGGDVIPHEAVRAAAGRRRLQRAIRPIRRGGARCFPM